MNYAIPCRWYFSDIHPQRTLKGLGTATKTAAIGGAVGYVGWEKLTTDKSVAGIVGDAVHGEGTMESVGNTVSGAVGGVRDLTNKVGGMTDSVNNAMTDGTLRQLHEKYGLVYGY